MARVAQPMTTRTNMDSNILRAAPMDGKTASEFGFDAQSTKCVGLAKLRNRVCKLLWTQRGSNPMDLEEGTDLADLYTYNVSDEQAAAVAVQNALSSAMSQIQTSQELAGSSSEERLTALELRNVYIEAQGISRILHITISIYSAAGESATFELPSAVA